jgi:hypothetical protein
MSKCNLTQPHTCPDFCPRYLFPLQVIDPDQFPFADVHAGWVGMEDDADTLHARLERLSELARHAAPED